MAPIKPAQYVRIERRIAADETHSIRERWAWGLRILNDSAATGEGGRLRHGVTETLISASHDRGCTVSSREIQNRVQCARAYPFEEQIAAACRDYSTWFELRDARFPDYPAPEGAVAPDIRTDAEREHDNKARLLEMVGDQYSMFPLDRFDPGTTQLKELFDYADQQDGMTWRFMLRGITRRKGILPLAAAVNQDLSALWADAHLAAHGDTPPEDGQPVEVGFTDILAFVERMYREERGGDGE